ncbi:MAG: tetratricopeptide repeat protein [Spirochaetes bacterium]|nr:tetratricopeptide repeat protein [Spirochaetota bacterium]
MDVRKHYFVCVVFLAVCTLAQRLSSAGIGNSTQLYREGAKLARSGKLDSAIAKFKEAIARNPYYSLAHYGLGKAYLYKEGKTKDAIFHLERAVQLDTKHAKAFFYLGIAYMLHKKMIKAIHAFGNALRCDATYIEAIYNIASAYEMMGYESKAYLYFEMYLAKKERTERDILF